MPITVQVSLRESLDLSDLQFPHLQNGGGGKVLDDMQGPPGFKMPIMFTNKGLISTLLI